MISCFMITAFAENTASVYVDKVFLNYGEPVMIPVRIKDNSGIMGFKITVEYNPDELELITVSKGEITANGNFSTNVGVNKGVVDIVWNNTADIVGDGTLFIISAKILSESLEYSQLNFSYSQPDTFNEAWEDVELQCSSITLTKDNGEQLLTEEIDEQSKYVNDGDAQDSPQILDAVDIALDKYGYDNLSDVENEAQFVSDVNNYLNLIVGDDSPKAESLADVVGIYEDAFSNYFEDELLNNLTDGEVAQAIASALNTVGAEKMEDVSENDRASFIESFYNSVKERCEEIPDISSRVSDDKAMEIIAGINSNEGQVSESENNTTKLNLIIVAVAAAVLVIAVAGTVAVILKKKKTKKPIE